MATTVGLGFYRSRFKDDLGHAIQKEVHAVFFVEIESRSASTGWTSKFWSSCHERKASSSNAAQVMVWPNPTPAILRSI